MGKTHHIEQRPTVYYPAELERQRYTGDLFGYHHPDTNVYNITGWEGANGSGPKRIGRIVENGSGSDAVPGLLGTWSGDGPIFFRNGRPCDSHPYTLALDVFSRNTGILETETMLGTSVILSGLGSVGSLAALELARAGVGRFLLVDNDILAYHNLCRHQCAIPDVGRYKVDAVRDRILGINPAAGVEVFTGILEEVPKAVFDDFIGPASLIMGAADNREGDLYANRIATLYGIPFVSVGFWERAFAGEIFYSLPGRTPCYECLFGGHGRGISNRVSRNRRFYTTETDLARTRFEPGISMDISFITTIGVKLSLDLLNRGNEDYIPRLLDHLTQFTLVCNTSDPRIGGDPAEIFSHPLQVTRSICVEYDPDCPTCGAQED